MTTEGQEQKVCFIYVTIIIFIIFIIIIITIYLLFIFFICYLTGNRHPVIAILFGALIPNLLNSISVIKNLV